MSSLRAGPSFSSVPVQHQPTPNPALRGALLKCSIVTEIIILSFYGAKENKAGEDCGKSSRPSRPHPCQGRINRSWTISKSFCLASLSYPFHPAVCLGLENIRFPLRKKHETRPQGASPRLSKKQNYVPAIWQRWTSKARAAFHILLLVGKQSDAFWSNSVKRVFPSISQSST